jgi:hypothetical protein
MIGLMCFPLVFVGCASSSVPSKVAIPAKGTVAVGMTFPEVVSILGTHYKKCNHSMVGHYTLVYDDVAVRIRDGRVYEVGSSASWLEIMKNVPYGGEYP